MSWKTDGGKTTKYIKKKLRYSMRIPRMQYMVFKCFAHCFKNVRVKKVNLSFGWTCFQKASLLSS